MERQEQNQDWWQQNPMTYDWEKTLNIESWSREWFAEIDRRFLEASYFARRADGAPFGRLLKPETLAGRTVLEIGCGMGTHASLISKAGANLTAIDLTEFAKKTTRKRFELFGLKGKIERADAEKLPFGSAEFDVVWSWGVIHHSNCMEDCICEITRVLRPGGRFAFMVYYRPSLVYYLHCGFVRGILMGRLLKENMQAIYEDSTDGFFARVFNKQELRNLLEKDYKKVSFEVVGLKGELYPIPRTRFKEWLEQITPNWLASAVLGCWGSMIMVEAVRK